MSCATPGNGISQTCSGATAPFQHIAEVNALTYAAGDQILFAKGQTWRETLTVPTSGSAGTPITIGTYGTGAKPIIKGSDIITSWTNPVTIQFGGGSDDFTDTNPSSTAADTNYDAGMGGANQAWAYYTLAGGRAYHLLRRDISSLAGKTILTAILSVYVPSVGGTPTLLRPYSMKNTPGTTWGANTATYNHYDGAGGHGWTGGHDGGIGDIDKQLAVDVTTVTAGWKTFSFNEDGLSFIDTNKAGTINILLYGEGSGAGNNEYFIYATEYAVDTAKRPKLVVTATGTEGVDNVWQAAATTEPKAVYFNGVKGTKTASLATVDDALEWWWESNILYVYGTSSPTNIEAAVRNDGIVLTDKDFITIDGIDISQVIRWGIDGHGTATDTNDSDNITIKNCEISYCGVGDGSNDPVGIFVGHFADNWLVDSNIIHDVFTTYPQISGYGGGIYIGASHAHPTDYPSTNSTYSNNTVYNVNGGIILKYKSVGNVIEHNTIHDMIGADPFGIMIVGSTVAGNIVRYNNIYNVGAGGDGIRTFNYGNIYYNIIRECANAAILVISNSAATEDLMDSGDNNTIYNNTLYSGTTGVIGLSFSQTAVLTCSSNAIKNNILSGFYRHVWWVFDDTFAGSNVFANNDYHNGSGTGQFYVGAGNKTFADWVTYSGEANSIQTDPLFISTSDFRLRGNSPAKNAGTDVSLTTDYAGKAVKNPPSMGAYEFWGGSFGPQEGLNWWWNKLFE